MIDDIRKKHEADKIRYTNSMWDRKWAVANSTLSIADVDSLFAALDSLREEASLYQKEWAKLRAALDDALDGLTAAHMHGFEEGRDQYRDKVRKLQAALDEARGKVERATNLISEAMETYTNLQDEHPYFVDVFDKLGEILKGGGG